MPLWIVTYQTCSELKTNTGIQHQTRCYSVWAQRSRIKSTSLFFSNLFALESCRACECCSSNACNSCEQQFFFVLVEELYVCRWWWFLQQSVLLGLRGTTKNLTRARALFFTYANLLDQVDCRSSSSVSATYSESCRKPIHFNLLIMKKKKQSN